MHAFNSNRLRWLGIAAFAAAATPVAAQVLLSPNAFEIGVSGVTFQNGGFIPDGNPGGWADTRLIQTPENKSIISVVVSLVIDGGYNGDFYAYLRAPGGQISILLNRVGSTSENSFGSSDAGLNITLRDNAPTDVHLYDSTTFNLDTSGRLTGAWQPDGRPATSLVTDTSPRTAPLSTFSGTQPDGNWTLFIADLSTGEVGAIKSWGIQMTVVPEPRDWTLASAAALILFSACRSNRRPSV